MNSMHQLLMVIKIKNEIHIELTPYLKKVLFQFYVKFPFPVPDSMQLFVLTFFIIELQTFDN